MLDFVCLFLWFLGVGVDVALGEPQSYELGFWVWTWTSNLLAIKRLLTKHGWGNICGSSHLREGFGIWTFLGRRLST